MNKPTLPVFASLLAILILLSACTPKATPTGPSQDNQISTRAAELASVMLT